MKRNIVSKTLLALFAFALLTGMAVAQTATTQAAKTPKSDSAMAAPAARGFTRHQFGHQGSTRCSSRYRGKVFAKDY